ncbi:hypothetical protein EHM92_01835 [bacterium]|nr:MAG: hypothetical protein EHM92_01835 [bacterium]
MKYSLLFLLLFAFASTGLAQVKTEETRTTVNPKSGDTTVTMSTIIAKSEDITPRSQMIVVNPLKFFLFYNLTYFHRLSAGSAVGIGLQMPTLSGIDGFGINAELRFYPSSRSLRGFYFAPNIAYNRLSTTVFSKTVESSPLSIGVLLGWQWFPGDDFAMGLGLGMDYYTSTNSDRDLFSRYDGTVPVVRFDIGYAW